MQNYSLKLSTDTTNYMLSFCTVQEASRFACCSHTCRSAVIPSFRSFILRDFPTVGADLRDRAIKEAPQNDPRWRVLASLLYTEQLSYRDIFAGQGPALPGMASIHALPPGGFVTMTAHTVKFWGPNRKPVYKFEFKSKNPSAICARSDGAVIVSLVDYMGRFTEARCVTWMGKSHSFCTDIDRDPPSIKTIVALADCRFATQSHTGLVHIWGGEEKPQLEREIVITKTLDIDGKPKTFTVPINCITGFGNQLLCGAQDGIFRSVSPLDGTHRRLSGLPEPISSISEPVNGRVALGTAKGSQIRSCTEPTDLVSKLMPYKVLDLLTNGNFIGHEIAKVPTPAQLVSETGTPLADVNHCKTIPLKSGRFARHQVSSSLISYSANGRSSSEIFNGRVSFACPLPREQIAMCVKTSVNNGADYTYRLAVLVPDVDALVQKLEPTIPVDG